jgi:hypothetical protein
VAALLLRTIQGAVRVGAVVVVVYRGVTRGDHHVGGGTGSWARRRGEKMRR